MRFSETGPEGVALAAEDGKRWLGNPPSLRFAEAPVPKYWNFQFEPGRCIGHRLREGPRQDLVKGRFSGVAVALEVMPFSQIEVRKAS
ncbi:MAG: hypothetical protein HYU85_03385 [Chloroflexi bacterium]|nr:hypothetical protein [Chloroflexota bacterium]MBI3040746.1 hypothetical protein [Chloroflexota bacterium]